MKKGWFTEWFPKNEAISQEPFRTVDYAFGLFVFFVAFGVYLLTLTPTVGFHDSGELITVAYTLSIAHPPGYPLYTIFGKLWTTLIPIGNIAFRMNMQSALFASLAVMMVYFITLKLTQLKTQNLKLKTIPAVVASLILAFSLTFWEQAVIAEKYTLNAFFFTLLIFILLKWKESKETQNLKLKTQNYLYLFSFILGLSFTHHFQTIYLVPASIFFILATLLNHRDTKTQRKKLKTENLKLKTILSQLLTPHSSLITLSKMALLFILPLVLWVYLPIRASQEPILNWGDPSNWENFIFHITGLLPYRNYLSSTKESFHYLIPHLRFFTSQFTIYILWIGFFGILIFLWRKRIIFLFFLLIFTTNIIHSIHYTIANIQDYYISSFVLSAILIGSGLSFVINLVESHLIAISFSFLLLIVPYYTYHFQNNKAKYYLAYDYAINSIKPLKEKGIFLVKGDDPRFQIWYLQMVENIRKDITMPDWYNDWYNDKTVNNIGSDNVNIQLGGKKIIMQIQSFSNSLSNIVNNNIDTRPIYFHAYTKIKYPYFLIPEGMGYRIFKKRLDEKELIKKINKTQHDFKIRGLYDKTIFKKDSRTEECIKNCAITYNDYGSFYSNLGLYDKAIVKFKEALNIYPDSEKFRENFKDAFHNLKVIV